MTVSTMPKDDFAESIPVLCPIVAQKISLTTSTARNSTNFTHNVIIITSDVDCFVVLGSSSVVAAVTDHFLPAGVPWAMNVGTNVRLAGIVASGTGNLYISEMT